MFTAIVGVNWGDEGKGRMVDLLSEKFDIVARYQGGNNAGHTVINGGAKFVLNLLPSGILRENTVNVLGGGMVVDIEHLKKEITALRERGVTITPDNLKISELATVCAPFHKLLDELEEDRLGDEKFGSTRRGIAPAYADRSMKKAIRLGDLTGDLNSPAFADKIHKLVQWKNLTVTSYGHKGVDADEFLAWIREFGAFAQPFITDVSTFLEQADEAGKNVLLEAQLGALRDIDFGIYPYTSSSSTISANACASAGVPQKRLGAVIGVVKAYSSCVGEGPFTAEFFGEEADELRKRGGDAGEYGAATGRPRRVGAFDAVASRYGAKIQGATEIALTNLDVLSYLGKIPVCRAYNIDGAITTDFPKGERLAKAKPVIEYLPGFGKDISTCRKVDDLPENALNYVHYVEQSINTPIKYVSVGPSREQYIEMT